MGKTVLVVGFYSKSNLGDNLFIDAFRHLLPGIPMTFVDHLDATNLRNASSVIFGGGSFLLESPNVAPEAFSLLEQLPICYLGVGIEKDIHPQHLQLMKQAKLIAIRTPNQLDRVRQINSNAIVIPDLVYALASQASQLPRQPKKVLIVPNTLVIPKWSDPHWKHAAWNYFKSEFCQFLDYLVEQNYQLSFFPMCLNSETSDVRAAQELINGMQHCGTACLLDYSISDFRGATQHFSQAAAVITQRFHGIVLSDITHTPCLTISHHDKLKDTSLNISYYGAKKDALIDAFQHAISMKETSHLPIDTHSFEEMKQAVFNGALCWDQT